MGYFERIFHLGQFPCCLCLTNFCKLKEFFAATGVVFVKQCRLGDAPDGVSKGHMHFHCDELEAIRSMAGIFRHAIRCVNSLSSCMKLHPNYKCSFSGVGTGVCGGICCWRAKGDHHGLPVLDHSSQTAGDKMCRINTTVWVINTFFIISCQMIHALGSICCQDNVLKFLKTHSEVSFWSTRPLACEASLMCSYILLHQSASVLGRAGRKSRNQLKALTIMANSHVWVDYTKLRIKTV